MIPAFDSRRIAEALQRMDNPVERLDIAAALSRVNKPEDAPKWVLNRLADLGIIVTQSAKSLTKAGRNEVDSALKALDEIPDVGPGEIAVPWVMTNPPKLEDEEWRESVVKNVPIGTLLASQPRLTRERVEYFILNTGSVEEGRRAFPNVYHRGNEWVIVDGHHRLAALWLLGADHANVWLLEGSE